MNSKWTKVILVALLCAILFCMVATMTNMIEAADLPVNIVAALLEAVITAVITVVLLSGQSAAEEVKERNVKVFEKKAAIFQNYIDKVWEIWEDRIVDKDEYRELTALYYRSLMIYLNPKSLEAIGEALSLMGDCIDTDATETDNRRLRDAVFAIIDTLSTELALGGKIDTRIYEELERKRST